MKHKKTWIVFLVMMHYAYKTGDTCVYMRIDDWDLYICLGWRIPYPEVPMEKSKYIQHSSIPLSLQRTDWLWDLVFSLTKHRISLPD